jgi:rare lipoprotein A
MLKSMRSGATNKLVAIALAGLLTSGPAQAVGTQDAAPTGNSAATDDSARIIDLIEVVSTLKEAVQAPAAPTAHTYQTIGEGEASYYGAELAGNRTASGERFNPNAMTAAHRTLPLGTKLRVTNKANGKSVLVRINDRGPFVGNRLIDLSLGAAREIGMVRAGKARVTLETLRVA